MLSKMIDIDGIETEVFSTGEAASYLGISGTAFQNKLNAMEKDGNPIPRYKITGQQKWIAKKDLDDLKKARRV